MPVALAALLAALLASARGRSLAVDGDVRVAGHSAGQLNATRYDVLQAQDQDRAAEAPDVYLDGLGTLRGTVSYSEQRQRPIFQYLGVPFGEAPVGDLRFLAPVPKGPWEGVRDATAQGKICIQTDDSVLLADDRRRRRDVPRDLEQSEDCLVLNVHTPKVDPAAKLAVLVFVHGGSFLTGYAGLKTPEGLLDEDMVLVSPQYRLGPLGFLNLQTDAVPGNAGLLDLVEALRWVNRYISYFGGDPSRVTLGGHSAGAASASLLYLSPLTKGLISAVMPMSGSALGFWGLDRSPEQANEMLTEAVQCGGPATPMEQRVACLRTAPASHLSQSFVLIALKALLGGELEMSGITPSVQRAGAIRVLTGLPEDVLSSSDFTPLPYLTGVTKHEGTFPLEIAEVGYLVPNQLMGNTSFVRNDLIHVLLKVIGTDDAAGFVADSVLQAFLDLETLGDYTAMRNGLVDLMGSFAFKSPARRIVERNSELGQPSFLYAFNHNGTNTQSASEGIFHGADQPYIFPDDTKFEGNDLNVAMTLRKLVSNFVIYHDPTPAASPVTVAGLPSWPAFARDAEAFLEVVWPPSPRQWFRSQLTVVRRDAEGGSATPGHGSAAALALPARATLVTLAVVLVARACGRTSGHP